MVKHDNSHKEAKKCLPAERRNAILNILTQKKTVTIPELADALDTTEITIRRDLTSLSEANLLRRVRGGAMSISAAAQPATSSKEESTLPVESGMPSFNHRTSNKLIGILVPEPSFLWPSVLDSIQQALEPTGFSALIQTTAYDDDMHDEKTLQSLAENPDVQGLIVVPNSHPDISAKTWEWMEQTDIPIVVMNREQPPLCENPIDSVAVNYAYGVQKAALLFKKNHHSHIGAAFSQTTTSGIINKAWHDVLANTHDFDCPFILTDIMPYDAQNVRKVAQTIIDTGVTAVLAHSDYLAIAIAHALEVYGKSVPKDVSLISIDGFAMPSVRPLTSLRSPNHALAFEAVSLLLEKIADPNQVTRHVLLDPDLIDFGSVASLEKSESIPAKE